LQVFHGFFRKNYRIFCSIFTIIIDIQYFRKLGMQKKSLSIYNTPFGEIIFTGILYMNSGKTFDRRSGVQAIPAGIAGCKTIMI
jgi:hypothetical protein